MRKFVSLLRKPPLDVEERILRLQKRALMGWPLFEEAAMILIDREIRELCSGDNERLKMIEPFSEGSTSSSTISYGLSSAGYDLRMGGEALVFKSSACEVIDPKRFRERCYVERLYDKKIVLEGQYLLIPPNGYALVSGYEYLRIPDGIMGICMGKSTLARCGVQVNITPLEPGWQGHLTIEVKNDNCCPVALYPMEGIAQLVFLRLSDRPEKTYADKKGKYQYQTGVTLPVVY